MTFDAEQFMRSVHTEANATSLPPCPEDEYQGVIGDTKIASGIVQKPGSKMLGQTWYRLDFTVETFDPKAIANLEGRTSRKIFAGIMLDLTSSGGLATGPDRNIPLGQLRKAAGLNKPGEQFTFEMLNGRNIKFQVKNETDQNDPTVIRSKAVGFREA